MMPRYALALSKAVPFSYSEHYLSVAAIIESSIALMSLIAVYDQDESKMILIPFCSVCTVCAWKLQRPGIKM